MHGISFLVTVLFTFKKVSDSFLKLNAFLYKMLTFTFLWMLICCKLSQVFASLHNHRQTLYLLKREEIEVSMHYGLHNHRNMELGRFNSNAIKKSFLYNFLLFHGSTHRYIQYCNLSYYVFGRFYWHKISNVHLYRNALHVKAWGTGLL